MGGLADWEHASIPMTVNELPQSRCAEPRPICWVPGYGACHEWVGKNFHTAEASFRRAAASRGAFRSKGRENLRPTRWYPSACETWMVRARRLRAARGSDAAAARGALGISSKTCADGGRERRTATKAPPAPTFSAVANSRNSLPFSSRLRTNTGMANARRVHLRRSFSCLRRIKGDPLNYRFARSWWHLTGQIGGRRRRTAPLSQEIVG